MPFTIRTGVVEQNQTKLIGYIPDFIDILQARMEFIPHFIYSRENQTYTGTATRSEIVDFSTAIFDNSIRIVVRQTTNINVDYFSYLKPFAIDLWTILILSTVFAAIVICILERQDNKVLQNKSIVSAPVP
jgi:hypothetical protein